MIEDGRTRSMRERLHVMGFHEHDFGGGEPLPSWWVLAARHLVQTTGMSWAQAVMIAAGEDELFCEMAARTLFRKFGMGRTGRLWSRKKI